MISISRGNYKLEAAVMVQPGHADNAISISLGYGRAQVRTRRQGCRVQRQSDPHVRWRSGSRRDLHIASTGNTFKHATTQEHGPGDNGVNAEHERPAACRAKCSIEEYKKNPKVDRRDVGGSRASFDLSGVHLR